ncbi:MAG: hypothetical protein COU08_01585 [Candidatus Harrisonbacteria bacterium CG10_big_fil_rev_8_21_14_0_10_42_17]|uniref:DUF2029 domain-containing protein n=1 Tax=Candidatus Harrisonbacteria bacterium CG10_big_fil_rev_8_21_14_0_10_42_17 TaxID=1974584 RepID=A0A2M6WIP6_9BACT|nr:MAG: hypothetical protein COU08_01585 [Candidatus Harrisonbacteria bacterium CG10_big_fil_rev_8_21_14_0_10_42_17]
MKPFSLRTVLLGLFFAFLVSGVFHSLYLFGIEDFFGIHYSDILVFYNITAAPGLYYLTAFLEYPILTGLFIEFMFFLGGSLLGYYVLTAVSLFVVALLSTLLLYRMISPQRREYLLFYWALAPSLIVMAVYNWDVLILLPVILAFYFAQRKQPLFAAASLAIAFSLKFYPILYFVILFLTERSNAVRLKIAGVFSFVLVLLNGAFALKNFSGWFYFFAFNSERTHNPDTIWSVYTVLFGSLIPSSILNPLTAFLFGTAFVLILYRFRTASFVQLSFLATLLFLLLNKVFSPQYLFWLLPFYVLVYAPPKKLFYVFEIANIIVLLTVIVWGFGGAVNDDLAFLVLGFVLVRHLALFFIFLNVCFGIRLTLK